DTAAWPVPQRPLHLPGSHGQNLVYRRGAKEMMTRRFASGRSMRRKMQGKADQPVPGGRCLRASTVYRHDGLDQRQPQAVGFGIKAAGSIPAKEAAEHAVDLLLR